MRIQYDITSALKINKASEEGQLRKIPLETEFNEVLNNEKEFYNTVKNNEGIKIKATVIKTNACLFGDDSNITEDTITGRVYTYYDKLNRRDIVIVKDRKNSNHYKALHCGNLIIDYRNLLVKEIEFVN